ncbi:MAG: inorganic diphosphatase [Pyrinomonadaceae bacterium]
MTRKTSLIELSAFDEESEELNVIIETPKGSRNKFNYDEKLELFKLGGVLPAGAVFPFDFGFVPSTKGGDGDPLDVLVLMDEPAFAGCLVRVRLLGVIEADQTEEDGEKTRNDRLVGVAATSRQHQDVRTLEQLSEIMVKEIEHFFVSYNDVKGKVFEPLGRFGPSRAKKIVEEGVELFRRQKRKSSGKKRALSSKSGGGRKKS